MKTINVVAAITIKDHKIFATQRGYGAYKDGWEFPGGKIEAGETARQALEREIREELDADIEAGEMLAAIEYDYPDFHLSMQCFLARLCGGGLTLKEHAAAAWLPAEELESVDWLPADREVIPRVRERLQSGS